VSILREAPIEYQTDSDRQAGLSSTVDQRIERLEKASDFGAVRFRERTGNPQVLHMYYFKSIDMTLMVNVLKKEIVTWRTGLEHK